MYLKENKASKVFRLLTHTEHYMQIALTYMSVDNVAFF